MPTWTKAKRTPRKRWIATTPTANYVVKYKKAETEQLLGGLSACELTERTYVSSVWWVLSEPKTDM